ncbi:MAG: hypothetical protein QE263_09770 [Vampirovibrionales bacterium]|nr:hypothetical protein [Vampirovibrionales bacterium]
MLQLNSYSATRFGYGPIDPSDAQQVQDEAERIKASLPDGGFPPGTDPTQWPQYVQDVYNDIVQLSADATFAQSHPDIQAQLTALWAKKRA